MAVIENEDLVRARDIIRELKANLPRYPLLKDVYINKDRSHVVFQSKSRGVFALPLATFLSLYREVNS